MWDEKKTKELISLRMRGMGPSRIADKLGLTKNQVIGKLFRIDGKGKKKLYPEIEMFRQKSNRAPIGFSVKELPNRGFCQWPIDDGWCGCGTMVGKPYCEKHLKQSYSGKKYDIESDIKFIKWAEKVYKRF